MKHSTRGQEGFILAITLWILALMTLAASFFAVWTQDAVDITRQNKDDVQGDIEVSSTISIALYLLATQRITPRGLPVLTAKSNSATVIPGQEPVLSIAGLNYRGTGSAYFSIQEEGGLLRFNALPRFPHVFGMLGVPSGAIAPLFPKLLDYIDLDNLTRINGAEATEYAKAGLPAPANRKLFTSWELRNVLDWNRYKGLWKDHALPRYVTAADLGGIININTAPPLLLAFLEGLDENATARISMRRQQTPFMSAGELSGAAGRPLNLANLEMEIEVAPTNQYRITAWSKDGLRMREVHINLTLEDANSPSPWLLDYSLSVPLTTEQKRADEQSLAVPFFTQALLPRPE